MTELEKFIQRYVHGIHGSDFKTVATSRNPHGVNGVIADLATALAKDLKEKS